MATTIEAREHGTFDRLPLHSGGQPTVQRAGDDEGVIREFIDHVRGIIPLLEGVKNSIEESSSRIPKASMQLSKVTEATESATVEILNVLEAMTTNITRSEKDIREVQQFVQSCRVVPGADHSEEVLARVASVLSKTKESSMNIAIALQVQDITSQQLAGVSHTIESIRVQLAKALRRFDQTGDTGPEGAAPEDLRTAGGNTTGHFDSDADFSRAPDRQDRADEIIKQWADGKKF